MKVDFNEITNNLKIDKIKELMESLSIPLWRETDEYLLYPTACHNHDVENASYKLYVYKDSKIFMCYTECGGQSIFNFLKNYYEARGIDYNWSSDVLDVVIRCTDLDSRFDNFIDGDKDVYRSERYKYLPQKQREPLDIYPPGLVDVFVKNYPKEWLKDGITKEAMDKYNIRFSFTQNKIIIPHYNKDGDLVGVRSRLLNPSEIKFVGKYMPVEIEGKWYSHRLGQNLYGLNVNKNNISNYGICFIAEGEKSVLQAEDFFRPNCTVAICGSSLSKYHIDLLINLKTLSPLEIVLCFDNEQAEQGREKYFNYLWNLCNKYKHYANFSFIFDREGLLGDKESPFDRGQAVFEKLLDRRVRL